MGGGGRVTREHSLDLVEQTTLVLLSRMSMLVRNTRGGVLSTGQTSLGVRVAVSSTSGRRRVVVKVTGDTVSRDTGILLVAVRTSVGARRGSVNVEPVGTGGSGQVGSSDTLVSGSTLVSCVAS